MYVVAAVFPCVRLQAITTLLQSYNCNLFDSLLCVLLWPCSVPSPRLEAL